MLRLICTKLKERALPCIHGYMLFSTSITVPKSTKTLTVSYLKNSCGMSSESAISAAQKLHIEAGHNPDSVLSLFRAHGLSQTQIDSLISKRPVLLLADVDSKLGPNLDLLKSLGFSGTSISQVVLKFPHMLESNARSVVEFFKIQGFSEEEIVTMIVRRPDLFSYKDAQKIFKPKMDFFKLVGFSEVDIRRVLSLRPHILAYSLENIIIPSVQFLRRFLGNDEDVVNVIKKWNGVIEKPLEKQLERIVAILRSHGVPHSLIVSMFLQHPRALLRSPERLGEAAEFVKKLGVNPKTLLFLLAVRTLAVMTNTLWEKKFETFMSFGMSEDDVYLAFKRQPMCMISSVKKIQKMMNFLVNKVKLKPSSISTHPNMILLSLERRVIPRCSVLQLLLSEQLIELDVKRVVYVLGMTEKAFTLRIMSKYKEVVPDVIKAHKGEIEFDGFSFPLSL